MKSPAAVAVVGVLLLGGCTAVGYRYNPRTPSVDSNPEECSIHIVDSWPYAGYEEVGYLEVESFRGKRAATDYGEFYRAVRADVCKAGGEVVLPQINSAGEYIRGIVLRRSRTWSQPPVPQQTIPPVSPSAAL